MSFRLWCYSTLGVDKSWKATGVVADAPHENYDRQPYQVYEWQKEKNVMTKHEPTGVYEVPASRKELETRASGAMTVNEVREHEDTPPMEGGATLNRGKPHTPESGGEALEVRSKVPGVIETRTFPATELRVVREEGKPSKIAGYAAVFNSDSQPLSIVGKDGKKRSFIETIAPGAFTRALSDGRDIVALVGHDPNQPLARTSQGLLTLKQDAKGLSFEVTPADTQRARDLMTDIECKNVKGVSFGFGDNTLDEWSKDSKGMLRRTLLDIDVREVSPTPFPAYEATSVGVRSLAGLETLEMRDHPGDYSTVASHAGYMARSCRSMSENMMQVRDTLQKHTGDLSDDEKQKVQDLHDSMKEMNKRTAEVRDLTRAKLAASDDDDDEDEPNDPPQVGEQRNKKPLPLEAALTNYAVRARMLELEQRS